MLTFGKQVPKVHFGRARHSSFPSGNGSAHSETGCPRALGLRSPPSHEEPMSAPYASVEGRFI